MGELNEKVLAQAQELEQIFEGAFVEVEVEKDLVKEAATLLLFSFSEYIVKSMEGDKGVLFEMLRVEAEQSKYTLLRIQSLNTLVKCAEKIAPSEIPNFLTYSLSSLNTPYLGLQVIAVKAIGVFCRKLRLSLLETNSITIPPTCIHQIISLIHSFSKETIHVFLDTLIELTKFSLEARQEVVGKIEQYIGELLEIALSDGLVGSQFVELFGGSATSKAIQAGLVRKLEETIQIKGWEETVELLVRVLEGNLENQVWLLEDTSQIDRFIISNIKNPKI